MDWVSDYWLDIVGWGGSALLVYSLLQARVLRFRTINTIGCVVLIFFNAMLSVWPMVGMNVVLAAINVWFIVRLLGERHDEAVFDVLEVQPDDQYLRHVLRLHGEDILRYQPDFTCEPGDGHEHAFIVMKGDETVGVVVLRRDGETARLLLDYVTPRYRDFTPGEFVWRRSGMLNALGVHRVTTSPNMIGAYYDHVGFRREGQEYVLDV
ncbi:MULTISPECIES: hypothetical protein [unclassified Nocardioides]|uniref:hypothetical protein n=1 Tax=unclassified Nocardioides TaxID=2615069 RepID=UPI00005701B7|nr:MULTISPECIES: hypothetical protein [unclassified Nocardioides]ABL82632.1 hypothetical protein Noca_3130 [Nocardioides sp. JS614]